MALRQLEELRTIPPEIGSLSNLNWIDLSDNLLTELPEEIGMLTGLTRLYGLMSAVQRHFR
eukprot:scaffold671717_cov46-Prasinocladus_malaysianus.AAC.2